MTKIMDRGGEWHYIPKSELNVYIGPLQAEDKNYLIEGLSQLSESSKRARFHIPKKMFSEQELIHLTEVDQIYHVAYGCLTYHPLSGKKSAIGTARFIRDKDNLDAAEFSLTIIDRYQGEGLGAVLLLKIIMRAKELGLSSLYGLAQKDNLAIRGLLEKFGFQRSEQGDLFCYHINPSNFLSDSFSFSQVLDGPVINSPFLQNSKPA